MERLEFFSTQIEKDEVDLGNPEFFSLQAKIFLQEVLESIQKADV